MSVSLSPGAILAGEDEHGSEESNEEQALQEPLGGAHRDPAEMGEVIRNAVLSSIEELEALSLDELLEQRQQRMADFGQFKEA